MITMRVSSAASVVLLSLLLGGCASSYDYDPSQPPSFVPGEAVPVEIAAAHLAGAVGKRITVSGLPRQREGSCRGAQPISSQDWMLTGETQCLWVNGRVPGASVMDVRPGLSDDPIEVTGILVISEQGSYVLKADRDRPLPQAGATEAPTTTP
jgi:hypothetical protein